MLLKLHRQAEHAVRLDRQASAAADFALTAAAAADQGEDEEEVSLYGGATSSSCSCSSSCPSSDDDDEATDEEEENRLVKRLVQSAFQRRKRKPSLLVTPEASNDSSESSDSSSASGAHVVAAAGCKTCYACPSPSRQFKRQRVAMYPKKGSSDDDESLVAFSSLLLLPSSTIPCPRVVANDAIHSYHHKNKSKSTTAAARGLNFSLSAPNLKTGLVINQQAPVPRTCNNDKAMDVPQVSPQDHLRAMHEQAGRPFLMRPALSRPEMFVTGSQEDYDMTVVQAVRSGNLEQIRSLAETEGRNLQCCNKFGESVVHTVARHGAVHVLNLLMELGVSVRVCCDSGRTPLSDACWTQTPPRMDMVDLLLDACPDLLYVTDKRGLAPLSYVPREHWEAWRAYLDLRGLDRLVPKHPPERVVP
jgi:hypothetical protein